MPNASLFTKEMHIEARFTALALTIDATPSLFFCWKPSLKAGMLFPLTHRPFHTTLDKVRKHTKILIQYLKCVEEFDLLWFN